MSPRRPSTSQHSTSQHSTSQHSTSQTSTSQTRARGSADEPPPRIMIMSCPDLHRPELRGAGASVPNPGDLGPARLFEQVIKVLTGFCPNVEVVEPGVCAFGARGPARYFGGETALAARIIAAVADLGVESRVGVADGLFAAFLAARTDPADPARGPTLPAQAPPATAATRSWSYRRARARGSWRRSR